MNSPWSAIKRLPEIGYPRSFPLVQFPNAPLAVGLIAGLLANSSGGTTHDYAQTLADLGISVWAYEELAHGVNWVRRLLGLVFVVVMVVRVARALHG